MASEWIKWVKGLSRRREVIVLARKLNVSRREAATACMELWEWADGETSDGHIRGATRDDIDLMLGIAGFSDALEAAEIGWLKFNSAGVTFQKWERHNGESAKRRAIESRKKRRQRELEGFGVSRENPDKCPDENGTLLLFSGSLSPVLDSPEFRKTLGNWLIYKDGRRENYEPIGLKAMLTRAANLATAHGLGAVIEAMQRAMANNWAGWDQDSTWKGLQNGKSGRGTSTSIPGPGQRYRPPASR